MTTPYYSVSGAPGTSAALTSATIRAEFVAIEAGFALLPTLSGNGSKAVVINAGGTALTVTTGTLTLAGNFATSGASALTLTTTGATNVTLPTTGTLSTLAGSEELTNKTLNASVGKGTWTASGTWTLPAVTLGGAITYGGVTLSNAVTGTGNMVLSASPTFTGTVTTAALSATTGVFTKATAGDSARFTNAAASNKSLYIYTDATVSGIFSTASGAGSANAFYFDNTTDTHYWQINGLSTRMNLSSTGLAVTGTFSSTGIGGIGAATSATTNLNLAAGTTGVSTLRIPHGSAPSAPVDGDMWTTTAGLYIRINGGTVGPLS